MILESGNTVMAAQYVNVNVSKQITCTQTCMDTKSRAADLASFSHIDYDFRDLDDIDPIPIISSATYIPEALV